MTLNECIEQRNGSYYMAATRVSLDSIVYSFRSGDSPETIRRNFPSLTFDTSVRRDRLLLGPSEDVDANIREGEEEMERLIPPLRESRPDVYLCGRLATCRRLLIGAPLPRGPAPRCTAMVFSVRDVVDALILIWVDDRPRDWLIVATKIPF